MRSLRACSPFERAETECPGAQLRPGTGGLGTAAAVCPRARFPSPKAERRGRSRAVLSRVRILGSTLLPEHPPRPARAVGSEEPLAAELSWVIAELGHTEPRCLRAQQRALPRPLLCFRQGKRNKEEEEEILI